MHQHLPTTRTPLPATLRTTLVALALVAVAAAAGAFCTQPAGAASLPQYLQTYKYVGQFGSHGAADGLLDFPNQITFGPNGDLYVADTHNWRIQEFMTDGMWVRSIGVTSRPDWGGGNLGFNQPQGVAVSSDRVWGVDYSGGLAWFSLTGTALGTTSGPNAPSDLFGQPNEAAVDGQSNVYVADGGINNRVDKFDSTGAFLCQISDTALLNPVAVGVNAAGAVFVADSVGGKVLRFSPTNVARTTYSLTATWSAGGLSTPYSIALDSAGEVFIGDIGLGDAGQVVKLSPSGKLLARWGSSGTADGQFTFLLGVAVDPATGSVYVADRDANRIQSFQLLDRGPKTYASASLSVKKGKVVNFKYGVAEDVSAKAITSIKIKKGTTVKKTLSLGSVKCGSWLTKKWTCTLAKGSYRWYVYAKDLGGNAQVLVGSKSLTVK